MKIFSGLFGPVARICVGLVSLTLFLVFVADLAFGVLRDDVELAQRVRKGIAEDLAIQLAVLIQKDDLDSIKRTIAAISGREAEVISVGVRKNSGDMYAESAEHPRVWVPLKDAKSTTTHVSVPVFAGKDVWGNVEMSFRPVVPKTWIGWVRHPLVMYAPHADRRRLPPLLLVHAPGARAPRPHQGDPGPGAQGHPGLRRRQPRHLVRGQLPGLRGGAAGAARRRRRPADTASSTAS